MPIIFPYPSDPIQTSLKREGLTSTSNAALAIAADLKARIVALDQTFASTLSWEETFGTMDKIRFALDEASEIPSCFALVHPDGHLREDARACAPRISAFVSELYMDDSVYRVLKRAEASFSETASPEQKKFITEVLRDYRRNGLDLATPKREQLKKINEELTTLGQTFEQNIAESKASIAISPEQLSGLPDQYIASHQPNEEGTVCITSDPPDIIPFLRYADDRKAALELFIKSENRAAAVNLPILDRLIELRKKKAALLGYPTWADYVLEERMAKTPSRVATFLESLHQRLQPSRSKEVELIERTAAKLGKNPTERINDPDAVYYAEKVRNTEFGLDSKELSEYFEIQSVERGVIDIASSLYGIRFQYKPNAATWHEEVKVYDIFDRNDMLLARIYLDLYPRDNKFKHAAMFTLRPTMIQEDGSRVIPMLALVCNFPKPGNQPALLEHNQVCTLFHEFGHCLHLVMSRANLASFSGTNVAHDFVEVPSQLFEEWAWERDSLDRFAKHYETGDRIPDDLFRAMQNARRFGQAIGTDRQIFYAMLDQAYHTQAQIDTTAILKELFPIYCPFMPIPGTFFQSHFSHLVGYDASYYGYQWALSIAKDIFTRFKASGLMNADTAQSYLRIILERGGSEEEEKMIEKFLGRPFSPDAYVNFLGIGNSSDNTEDRL